MTQKKHDEPAEDETPISAKLRIAGERLAAIGKQIEDSQIEDGDPPFRVTVEQYTALEGIAALIHRLQKNLTTKGEAEDYGEDVIGLRAGHEDE
jgi:hypothetical protein